MRVFISWSGPRSQALAKALREWMPLVLQHVKPWVSDVDIAAGVRWPQALAEELKSSEFGVICVTRENVASPWIFFEAGSLAKSLETSRVIPLLLDVEVSGLSGPLTQFQAKKVDKDGLNSVIDSINEASERPIPQASMNKLFEKLWPELETKVAAIPQSTVTEESARPQGEILEELIASVRLLDSRLRAAIQEEIAVPISGLTLHLKDFREHRIIQSGIVDYFTLEKQGEEVLTLLKSAEKRIRVCKTWIPEREYVEDGLREALRRGDTLKEVQIMCLDPDSPLAIQRSRDLRHKPLTKGKDKIRDDLMGLYHFCQREGFLDRVRIRTYTNLPSISLYAADDTALIGWYWRSQLALEGPVLKVKGELYDLGKHINQNFEKLWETASSYIPEVEDDCIWDAGHLRLPDDVTQELVLHATQRNGQSLDALRRRVLAHWPELGSYGSDILHHARNKGYLVIRNFPFNRLNPDARRWMFLLLTSVCGTPVSHISGKQDYVWEVTPQEVAHRPFPTYSENNVEAPLHTDSHYREKPEEFIAVLVEKPAMCGGGRTILLRIAHVLTKLGETDEGRLCLDTLRSQEFPSMVPSVYRGEDPYVTAPIVIGDKVRFRADTIEMGMKSVTQFKTPERTRALSLFKELVFESPDRRSVFLEKGDLLFINNYTVLHGRKAFEDKSRLLLRTRFNSPTSL